MTDLTVFNRTVVVTENVTFVKYDWLLTLSCTPEISPLSSEENNLSNRHRFDRR